MDGRRSTICTGVCEFWNCSNASVSELMAVLIWGFSISITVLQGFYGGRLGTDNNRLKIIASALNFEHCRQIVEAYRARGRRVDYVHSREDSAANQRVLDKLERHELDVIVQVRKLGEGFDHRYLSVAAVFSIYSNLSPFVQFVGRVMRVIEQDAPGHPLNHGVVVFHAGANVARRWEDFQKYSEADQEFFDQLLPLEGLEFDDRNELEVELSPRLEHDQCEVRSQEGVELEEIPLITDDPETLDALKVLRAKGYSGDEVKQAYEELRARTFYESNANAKQSATA